MSKPSETAMALAKELAREFMIGQAFNLVEDIHAIPYEKMAEMIDTTLQPAVWSRDIPIADGFYFYRKSNYYGPIQIFTQDDKRHVVFLSSTSSFTLEDLSGEFSGPLAAPQFQEREDTDGDTCNKR